MVDLPRIEDAIPESAAVSSRRRERVLMYGNGSRLRFGNRRAWRIEGRAHGYKW